MIKTRVTEILGIQYPIILGAMAAISSAKLVLAVSKAGGLGVLAAFGYLSKEDLRRDIRYIRENTDKPFGVNIFAGDPRERELAEVIVEEKVPIVSHGRGNPDWLLEASKTYNCIKMPTVGSLRHATKAEKDGADIIVVQGSEGGGHTGNVASSILIPEVIDHVKVPVVAAGGFSDGRSLVSALAMGAGAIYIGTRFALTQESPMAEAAKKYYLQAGLEDTGITDRITGHNCRMLKNKRFRKAERSKIRILPWQLLSDAIATSRMLKVSLWKLMRTGLNMKKVYGESLWQMALAAQMYPTMAKAVKEGDLDRGFMPAGQVVGRVDDMPACHELIQRIMQEAEEVLGKLKTLSSG